MWDTGELRAKPPPRQHCSQLNARTKRLCSLCHRAFSVISVAFNRPKLIRGTLYVLPGYSLTPHCTPEVIPEWAAAALCKATYTKGENGELADCLCCLLSLLCRGERSQHMFCRWCSVRRWRGVSWTRTKGG